MWFVRELLAGWLGVIVARKLQRLFSPNLDQTEELPFGLDILVTLSFAVILLTAAFITSLALSIPFWVGLLVFRGALDFISGIGNYLGSVSKTPGLSFILDTSGGWLLSAMYFAVMRFSAYEK